jgi:hypothetical protein
MATTGSIVDVDNFGDSDPSTPSRMLSYSAVLHPLLAPVVLGVATAQKLRSRQAATHFDGLQTTHRYSRRAPYVPLWACRNPRGSTATQGSRWLFIHTSILMTFRRHLRCRNSPESELFRLRCGQFVVRKHENPLRSGGGFLH